MPPRLAKKGETAAWPRIRHVECLPKQQESSLPHTLRPQLDEALRLEAEALQEAARLIASRASHREFAEVMRRVEELRTRRIAIQRQIEERRRNSAPVR